MVGSRSTVGDHATAISGRRALRRFMGPEVGGVGGVGGYGHTSAIKFIFDPRITSLYRQVLSVNILIFVNRVFFTKIWQPLVNFWS